MILSVCQYTSIKKTEISLKEPLSQSRLIWVLIFGVVFLGEVVSISRFIGTFFVLCGAIVLVFHPEQKWGRFSDSGVRWTLGTAVISATVALVDKFALGYFPSEMYAFLAFFVPAILLSCVVYRKKEALFHLLIVARFGESVYNKYDKDKYENKLKLLGCKDQVLMDACKHFRDCRREIVHEKAHFTQNNFRIAQDEARTSMKLVESICRFIESN